MKKTLTKKEKELYNQGVRDALMEVAKYDGIISSGHDRRFMVEQVPYKFFKPIKLR